MRRHFLPILLLALIAAAPTPRPTTISGTIKNKDNSPAPNCPIRLYEAKADNTPPGPTRIPPAIAETRTDDHGLFKLENIAPGNYRLVAGALFKDSAAADIKVVSGKPVTVELTLVPRKSKL